MSHTTNTSFVLDSEPTFVRIERGAPQMLSHSSGDSPIYYSRGRADLEGENFNPVALPTIAVGANHTFSRPVWIRTESKRDHSSVLLLATPDTPQPQEVNRP